MPELLSQPLQSELTFFLCLAISSHMLITVLLVDLLLLVVVLLLYQRLLSAIATLRESRGADCRTKSEEAQKPILKAAEDGHIAHDPCADFSFTFPGHTDYENQIAPTASPQAASSAKSGSSWRNEHEGHDDDRLCSGVLWSRPTSRTKTELCHEDAQKRPLTRDCDQNIVTNGRSSIKHPRFADGNQKSHRIRVDRRVSYPPPPASWVRGNSSRLGENSHAIQAASTTCTTPSLDFLVDGVGDTRIRDLLDTMVPRRRRFRFPSVRLSRKLSKDAQRQ